MSPLAGMSPLGWALLIGMSLFVAAIYYAVFGWERNREDHAGDAPREHPPPAIMTGGGWDNVPGIDASEPPPPTAPIWPPRGPHYRPQDGSTVERDARAEREALLRARRAQEDP